MTEVQPVVPAVTPAPGSETPAITTPPVAVAAENEAEKKLRQDLDHAVSELIELRKKKAFPEEERAKLEKQIADLEADLKKVKEERNDTLLGSLASTPTPTTPTGPTGPAVELSPEQEKLRKEKGWSIEKYLEMKEKHPSIVP